MWWKRKAKEPSATFVDRLGELEVSVRTLTRMLDDLEERFRSWRRRETREARSASGSEGTAPPPMTPRAEFKAWARRRHAEMETSRARPVRTEGNGA